MEMLCWWCAWGSTIFLLISVHSLCIQTGVHCNWMDAVCMWMIVFCHQTVVLVFLVIVHRQLYITPRWVHIVPGGIYFATRWLHNLFLPFDPFPMSFSVCCIDGVGDQDHLTTVTHCLQVPDSVTLTPGYDAMKEDPDIYKTTDLCGYAAPRQFPGMQLQSLVH